MKGVFPAVLIYSDSNQVASLPGLFFYRFVIRNIFDIIQMITRCFPSRVTYSAFLLAITFAPSSGEVWCEGGRMFLNPFSPFFSLQNARTCLSIALSLTPHNGDVYLEV